MNWLEKDSSSQAVGAVSASRSKTLDKVRDESLPVVAKQVSRGELPLDPVRLQPVKSPGIYEGEFGQKDFLEELGGGKTQLRKDIVFHFWPYGYGEALRANLAKPKLVDDFPHKLRAIMGREFGEARVEVSYDKDMGSWFVRAIGWGSNQFWFDNSVKACETLHKALGGT